MPVRSAFAPVISVMSVHPVLIAPEVSVARARALFGERGVRHLLVARHARALEGILSVSDLALSDRLADGEAVAVGTLMTAPPRCLQPDDSVGTAITLMLTESLHALPVVDDGDVVGLVTSHDILQRVFADVLPFNLASGLGMAS